MPQPLYLTKSHGTCFTGGPLDQRTGLDGCGKSLPHWGSHPEPSSCKKVGILTMSSPLPRLNIRVQCFD